MANKFIILKIIVLLFLSVNIQAQISSIFSADKTSGCSPLTVVFTNQSTGAITSWNWSFGNGNTGVGSATKTEIYTNPGTYTVTLVVSDGNQTSSSSQTIIVFANPVALFSATPLTGCPPLSVTFSDSSIVGSADLTSWSWVFGDGNIGTGDTLMHNYSNSGNYSVTLNITDQNGCVDSEQKQNFISVSPPPVISFSSTQTFSCEPPLTVNFSNNSSGTAPLSYVWILEDGDTSNVANPSHIYNDIGNYDIYLTVTDSKGCSVDTFLNNFVNVSNVIADFTSADTVCKSTATVFTNASIGGTSFLWNFGDGTATSTLQNPSHSFANIGQYTITLIATENANCKDTVSKTIYVESVTALMSQSATTFCDTPFVVNFTDNTIGNNVAWQWNFGNGTNSTDQNPSGTYTGFGSFTPSLIVTNNHGCKGTVNGTPIVIAKPTITLTSDINKGCIPLSVNFTDTSNSIQPITTWNWDFGDGGTDSIHNPTYTFNTAGDYWVIFNLVNSAGCNNLDSILIESGDSLDPIIFIDTAFSCAKEVIQFSDSTKPDSLADQWWWSFGENQGEATQQDASHTYIDTTGHFDIQFVVGYNGCFSDTLKDSVMIYGPIAELTVDMDCDSPFVYVFDIHVIDGQRYFLDFKDGHDTTVVFSDTSLFQTIIHTYDSIFRGQDFNVTLNAYNDTVNSPDSCDFDASVTVKIRDVIANFGISDTIPCTYESVIFNALDPDSTSQDASTYSWSKIPATLPTMTAAGSQISHVFTIDGFYLVQLIATDDNTCTDTIVKSINTYKPTVDFTTDKINICSRDSINFMDASTADTTIVDWHWDFGGGSVSDGEDTLYHTFNNIQSYTVSYTITDELGCFSTISKTIVSTRPKPKYLIADYTLCDGDSVKLTYTSAYNVAAPFTYLWNFDDGTTSTTASPYHTFTYPADTFIVSLYMVDTLGCDSLFADTLQLITVQPNPVAAFTVDTTVWDCYFPSHLFSFTDTTASNYLNYWYWTFGDGSVADSIQNPSASYTDDGPGVYDVTLLVSTTNGCSNTVVKPQYITVKGPLANMIVPPVVCRGDEVTMNVTDTSFVYSFEWFFGDGTNELTLNDTVLHTYFIDGNKTINLKLRTDSTDKCVITKSKPIYIHDLHANFIGGDINTCTNNAVTFTDASTNTSGSVNNWLWYYGDGNSDITQGPQTHLYSPGTYTVELFINNQFGCLDSLKKTFIVNSLPIVTVSNDTIICVGESVTLNATGGESYKWSPSIYLNNANTQNPVSTPLYQVYYNVTVTDANTCSNTADVSISVQHPISMDLFTIYNGNQSSNDTVFIIMGDTVHFNAVTDSTGLFSWTPSDYLSCNNCPNPFSNPTQSILYEVIAYDLNQCHFETTRYVYIDVSEATIDVPTAFTPNGDNNGNDVIFVKGWGIKTLLEFKIFNRWGQIVFETDDIKKGWDGKYLGTAQNVDTYVFIVRAEAYNGEILYKKGFINLIR